MGFELRRAILLAVVLATPLAADDFDYFEQRIRPVLVERCYKCHSATSEKLKGGLRLDTRAGVRQGGESGKAAVLPGNAEGSLLIEAIRHTNDELKMPPKGKLTDAQIADFTAWVNSGALDPRSEDVPSSKSKVQSAGHWAFKPVVSPPVPSVKNRKRVQTPVDNFILAKLEADQLNPSPPADKRTLLRRASYDLTGLPPTSAELDAFLRDKSPDAFAKVVDRLLASPHYGERWGRYWLDLARYSDTKGYVYDREEKRFVHSHVYRDWVIDAFNRDLPYDQFLLLQLAADQFMDHASRTASSDLAAMGFLTVGRRFLGVVHDIIDDRIDVLSRATMGLSVGCARCHDHKFDPIPTRDYYALYGVFNSSTEQTVPLPRTRPADKDYEDFAKGLREREEKLEKTFRAKRDALADRLRAKAPEYLLAVLDVAKLPSEEFYAIMGPDDLNPVIVRQWEASIFKARESFDPVFAPWHTYAALGEKDFAAKAAGVYEKLAGEDDPRRRANTLVLQAFAAAPPASMREVAQRYGRIFAGVDKAWRDAVAAAATNQTTAPSALDPHQEPVRQILHGTDSPASVPPGAVVDIEWFFDEGTRVELAKLQAEIDRWIIKAPGAPPHSVILADRPAPRNARVFLRGNPANKGEEVPRQFLEVVAGANRRPFAHGSGRLEMARAIVSRDNPLTARVMANRVWLHHFGAGLVSTPSDFGTRCEPPSHPELLDWLAARFMDGGWSVKALHRLILLSGVYQQASGEDRARADHDPNNRLLWRMNRQRLDFEAMRDSLLFASGELDLQVGGKPVELFKAPFSTRRAVYGYIDRQFLPGVFRVFDFANPDLHAPQRSDTTVPQQALFFMNSPFVADRAKALANRADVQAITKSSDRIRQFYQILYQRPATAKQVALGLGFLNSAPSEPPEPPSRPVVTQWRYGWGEYDAATQRVKNFEPLPHFTGEAWQGGAQWPDAKLGWVQLTAEGGHAGNDLQHAAIRRWIAPRDGAVNISGTARHENQEGDGVTARIVSSRAGSLGFWTLHNGKAEAKAESVEVKAGDTIDFVVDYRANLNSDMFMWSPVVRLAESAAVDTVSVEPTEWNSKKEFTGPPPAPPVPMTPWESYAQTLLLANEFLFVD